MDTEDIRRWAAGLIRKYRYVAAAVLAGILLLCLPDSSGEADVQPVQEPASQESLEQSLAGILSQVSGAGNVEVLLSPASGAETVYQSDTDSSPDQLRTDTVTVTDPERRETGLVTRIDPPRYQGALIVCQGANDASVRLSLVQAVSSVTGLTSDRIIVLKMK